MSFTGSVDSNPGTGPGQNYIGTADAKPLVIATSSTAAMVIDENGHVGIGGETTPAMLTVDGYLMVSPEGIVFPDGSVQRTAYKKNPRKKIEPFPWEGAASGNLQALEYREGASVGEYESQEERIRRLEQEVETLKKLLQEK